MTSLHIVVTKQKEAKSLLPVRHVAKHNFSQGASTFFQGVISLGINHARHKLKKSLTASPLRLAITSRLYLPSPRPFPLQYHAYAL